MVAGRKLLTVSILVFAGVLLGQVWFVTDLCRADGKGDGYISLKKALEEPGEAQIILRGNIRMRGTIVVRGKKTLIGNGHRLTRGTVSGKQFGGTLFCVAGGEFSLRETLVSGMGNGSRSESVYGRLVEVKRGRLVLGKKGVLKNNRNSSMGEEGGGAVIVRSGAEFLMEAGEISGNQTVTEGAAVYVEKGAKFCMKGGRLQENKSRGIGAVEGFDGRGGGIYNEGSVTISGGRVFGNKAVGFSGKKSRYGGVGGMIYNAGSCVISGGTIERNTASYGGGAVYSDRNSTLRIPGGKFRGNQAERGRTIFFCGASCYLNVSLDEGELAVKSGCRIRKGKRLSQETTSKPEGKREFIQTDKERTIVWNVDRKRRIYYTGEVLSEEDVLYGVRAVCGEKDISGDIELSRVSGKMGRFFRAEGTLDTSRKGRGELFFRLTDISGQTEEISVPYEIRENTPPRVRTAHRYLFTWEVNRYDNRRWREMLWEGVSVRDKEDSAKQLWEHAVIDWGEIRKGKAGSYTIRVMIRDQWGERFYAGKGKVWQYGAGNPVQAEIPVTLVSENLSGETEYGVVRFEKERETVCRVLQEWHFSSETLSSIRIYMSECGDPFSEEANNGFLKRFAGVGKIAEMSGG